MVLREDLSVATTVVSYELDEDTTVQFEIEPSAEFRPARSLGPTKSVQDY